MKRGFGGRKGAERGVKRGLGAKRRRKRGFGGRQEAQLLSLHRCSALPSLSAPPLELLHQLLVLGCRRTKQTGPPPSLPPCPPSELQEQPHNLPPFNAGFNPSPLIPPPPQPHSGLLTLLILSNSSKPPCVGTQNPSLPHRHKIKRVDPPPHPCCHPLPMEPLSKLPFLQTQQLLRPGAGFKADPACPQPKPCRSPLAPRLSSCTPRPPWLQRRSCG